MIVIEKPETKFEWTNVRNQYIATFAVDLIMLSHGIAVAWSSPAIPILASGSTPLVSGPLTNEEISWIGSINSFGAAFGAIFTGYTVSKFGSKRAVLLYAVPEALFWVGSKRAALLYAVPEALFWVLIYYGNHYFHIFGAELLFSGGAIVPALVLYISEVANDNIRGRLATSMMVLRSIGIFMVYTLGTTVDYFTMPCIFIAVPILFLIVFSFLPNTPQYHFQRGQTQKAENALKFYKGYKGDTKEEVDALFRELERLKAITNHQKIEEKIQISDFCDRNILRSLAICFALSAFAQFTLNNTIKSYAVIILKKTGASIDPNVSSIILGGAFIVGALLTSYSADILGRKFLNIVSLLGSAMGLSLVALYYYLRISGLNLSAFDWVPVTSLSFVILISSAGIIPLLFVCSVEILPPKIRVPGYVVINAWINIVIFLCNKLYPFLTETLDLHGCLIIFATGSAIGAIFVAFCMKETTGKCLDEVNIDKEMEIKRISTSIKC